MASLSVRPMTVSEFGPFREDLVRDYAAQNVAAGRWSAEEAERCAAEQTDGLLPSGVETEGHLFFVAESEGAVVGHLWLCMTVRPDSPEAWIYAIEIDADKRGRGYGRALLAAAEAEAASRGATVIALNVFGPNTVARSLYDSAGYEISSIQMRKTLRHPD